MTDELLYQERVPGGGTASFILRRGQTLRLTDVEGGANVSLLLFNADDRSERLNLPDTLKGQHTARLTAGHCLYSDMGRVLAAVGELEGDAGARELLARFRVHRWEAGHLASATDIDTLEELSRT